MFLQRGIDGCRFRTFQPLHTNRKQYLGLQLFWSLAIRRTCFLHIVYNQFSPICTPYKAQGSFYRYGCKVDPSIQVGFVKFLHFESLAKHIGHGDAWDVNCILEHVYFIGVVLLLSLFQSFNEWNDVGQVVNPKPVHHHHATLLREFSYEFIVFVVHNG